MHYAIYTLAAFVCARSVYAAPPFFFVGAPPASDVNDNDPLRRRDSPLKNLFPEKDGFIETGGPVRRETQWLKPPPFDHNKDADPLRRRDSPLKNLFPEKDGFIETGPPPPGENDNDPMRRRDSPLHNIPNDGVVELERPEPHIQDTHAWFVMFALLHLIVDC